MKRIGIIGSRDLACRILSWVSTQRQVIVIGVVPPPFKGWWEDNLRETAEKLKLNIFDDLSDMINQKPDLIFSVNYWKIIDIQTINRVPEGIINIHHSYRLKYRGRYSTSWAILNARKLNCWEHGSSIHYINDDLDAGPIIDSRKCSITEEDTAESLFQKVEVIAYEMFQDNFHKIINSEINSFVEMDNEFYYYDKNSNSNLQIEYGTSFLDVVDFVRAWSFKNRPKPFFKYNNLIIELSLKSEK